MRIASGPFAQFANVQTDKQGSEMCVYKKDGALKVRRVLINNMGQRAVKEQKELVQRPSADV